jgi:hypothetical protein
MNKNSNTPLTSLSDAKQASATKQPADAEEDDDMFEPLESSGDGSVSSFAKLWHPAFLTPPSATSRTSTTGSAATDKKAKSSDLLSIPVDQRKLDPVIAHYNEPLTWTSSIPKHLIRRLFIYHKGGTLPLSLWNNPTSRSLVKLADDIPNLSIRGTDSTAAAIDSARYQNSPVGPTTLFPATETASMPKATIATMTSTLSPTTLSKEESEQQAAFFKLYSFDPAPWIKLGIPIYWIPLPNVGRESHTFLLHKLAILIGLIETKTFPHDHLLALQGHVQDHLKYGSLYKFSDWHRYLTAAYVTPLRQWYPSGARIQHDEPYRTQLSQGKMKAAPFPFGDYYWLMMGRPLPTKYIWVSMTNHYAVSYSRVKTHSICFYLRILSMLCDHPNPEVGHYWERLCRTAFAGSEEIWGTETKPQINPTRTVQLTDGQNDELFIPVLH